MESSRTDRLASELREWRAPDALAPLRDEYLDFLAQGAEMIDRSSGPEHITASCFVFSQALDLVLLCFHRKGRFWVQLGGHVEPEDASVPAAALREAGEESGLDALVLLDALPLDIDRHALGGGFGACSRHWDIGYGALADPTAPLVVSDESDDVAWWPVDDLPAEVPPGFASRLAGAVAAARRLRAV